MGVTAIFDLPVPIWISTQTLGERFSAGFGSVAFDVLMPTAEGPVGTAPPLDGIEVPTHKPNSDELRTWVQRFAAFTPDNESTALCAIVIRTPGPDDRDRERYDLARAIDPWFDAVRTWVETVTGQDVDPHHRVYDATALGAGLTFLDGAGVGDGPIAFTFTTPRITPVPAEAWRRILVQVAALSEPPLEEQLSRDARAAFARGQYRRSVSDAASAAEIVLHRAIAVRVVPEDLPDSRLRRKLAALDQQPLGGLVTIARAADLDLGVDPGDLDDLSKVRNDAIHRGEVPEYWRASRGIQSAIDMLGHHGPWKRTGTLPEDGSEWVEVTAEPEVGP